MPDNDTDELLTHKGLWIEPKLTIGNWLTVTLTVFVLAQPLVVPITI